MHLPGITEMYNEVIGYRSIIGTRLKPLFVDHAPVSLVMGRSMDFLIRIVLGKRGKLARIVQVLNVQPCPIILVDAEGLDGE
jgi:hypothetical protein